MSENSSFCNAHNALSLSAPRALIKAREEILDKSLISIVVIQSTDYSEK